MIGLWDSVLRVMIIIAFVHSALAPAFLPWLDLTTASREVSHLLTPDAASAQPAEKPATSGQMTTSAAVTQTLYLPVIGQSMAAHPRPNAM